MSGPRYSIIPADAYADARVLDLHLRVLGILGTRTDNNGWCEVNQRKIAERCGRARETINRAIRDLCEFGYLTKQDQQTSANGRTISLYQVLMDRPARPPDAAHPVTSTSQGVVTQADHNGCDEPASQHNDPSSNEETPQPPLAGGPGFAALWEKYPIGHRGNEENARGAYGKLGPDEREAALASVSDVVTALARRKERIPALASYLRSRIFVEFHGAPPVDADGDFVIRPGCPEWSAWLGDIRKSHGERGVESAVKLGYCLRKSRWPAGHPQAWVQA